MARGLKKCCAASRMMMKCAEAPSHDNFIFNGGIFNSTSSGNKPILEKQAKNNLIVQHLH